MSDQELMHEVASGNEAAFGELYDRFGKLVFAWLGSFFRIDPSQKMLFRKYLYVSGGQLIGLTRSEPNW